MKAVNSIKFIFKKVSIYRSTDKGYKQKLFKCDTMGRTAAVLAEMAKIFAAPSDPPT